jgi:hypothetical protein
VKVKGIRWIGVGTPAVARMRSFATDVLGMRIAGQDTPELVELEMGDGAKLELFGSAAVADGPWMFDANPVVAGFLVDDIEAARDELARRPASHCSASFASCPTGARGSTSARPTATSTNSRRTPPPTPDTRADTPARRSRARPRRCRRCAAGGRRPARTRASARAVATSVRARR